MLIFRLILGIVTFAAFSGMLINGVIKLKKEYNNAKITTNESGQAKPGIDNEKARKRKRWVFYFGIIVCVICAVISIHALYRIIQLLISMQ